jgi:DNA-binding PadR family transcriptional regulator
VVAAAKRTKLTDNEAMLLALVARAQPITAYQIAKAYDLSPVSNFNTSKGKIYPIIKRLKQRGLVVAEEIAGDARGTERLSCTRAGLAEIRAWVMRVAPADLLLEDPLRSKLQSFDLLSPDQRLEWVANAQAGLQAKMDELDAYRDSVTTPFHALVDANAMASIRVRLTWLDLVCQELASDREDQPQ